MIMSENAAALIMLRGTLRSERSHHLALPAGLAAEPKHAHRVYQARVRERLRFSHPSSRQTPIISHCVSRLVRLCH